MTEKKEAPKKAATERSASEPKSEEGTKPTTSNTSEYLNPEDGSYNQEAMQQTNSAEDE